MMLIATPVEDEDVATVSEKKDPSSLNVTIPTEPKTSVVYFKDGNWSLEKLKSRNYTTLTSEQEILVHNLQTDNEEDPTICAWKWNETDLSKNCRELLSSATHDVTMWYFLGDSTMARPWRWCLLPKLENRSTTLKSAKGKQVKTYLGITKDETLSRLKAVNISRGEGPFIKRNFYKSGCSTCENRLLTFPQQSLLGNAENGATSAAYAEFLSIDFARDVEFATKNLDTTQEVIARYMQTQRRDLTGLRNATTACVVSSGMHDLRVPNLTDAMYFENYRAMKELLTRTSGSCNIWIQLELTAKGYSMPDDEDVRRINVWNTGIRRILKPNDFHIQLFERSLNAKHGDFVHMDTSSFYGPLAELFTYLMRIES